MIQDNKLSNGLYVAIDWLSFTLKQYSDILDVIEFLGFTPKDFKEIGFGGNGYKNRLEHVTADSLKIYFEPSKEDMGIHIDASGGAISVLLEVFVVK